MSRSIVGAAAGFAGAGASTEGLPAAAERNDAEADHCAQIVAAAIAPSAVQAGERPRRPERGGIGSERIASALNAPDRTSATSGHATPPRVQPCETQASDTKAATVAPRTAANRVPAAATAPASAN